MPGISRSIAVAAGMILAVGTGSASAQECERFFSESAADGDGFGFAMASDGLSVFVGSPYEDDDRLGRNSGAVYVYAIGDEGLTLRQRIAPPEESRNDWFGTALAIEGGTLVIGASGDDDNYTHSGSVFVYTIADGGWEFSRKIIAPDGAGGDNFGAAVELADGLLAVGAPGNDSVATRAGAVYLFDAGSGAVLRKLVADDGSLNDGFGRTLALHQDKVFVGVPGWDSLDGGMNAGAVYLFEAATGEQLVRLASPDPRWGQAFGTSFGFHGDTVLVGASGHYDFDANLADIGAVYCYRLSGVGMAPEGRVVADDAARYDSFGETMSVHEGIALIGAPQSWYGDGGSGKAYLLDIERRELVGVIEPENARAGSSLGTSLVLADDFAILGSAEFEEPFPQDGPYFEDVGGVLVFDRGLIGCEANLNGDCVVGQQDAGAFLAAFGKENPVADFNQDGKYDYFDVSAYVEAFVAGCR